MYCWNYKVASSFMMSLMYKFSMNGTELEPGVQPWTLQNKMSPRSLVQWRLGVQTFTNIILVRHPMVRLVSAYRDRIEGMKAAHRIYKHIDEGDYYQKRFECMI